ncbi:pitrilysin family protein [Flavobacterium sp. Fl-77]|uniref:Pitrilysin family protein n=1 Tax=Flavobacterium flavipigmentatum TaxID=2893884 RepID=A0AAJ2VWC0_9FLAO|nr:MULTISPECIES: pitrilysin family protein [unclassified Flavobacterium]MDX6181421.1 pitrilysin family protein [Flavobacterium sp. Fl-33]MDX6185023.1 pitrilysin family protein [Flavobacterium sp. Fl-77]UFH40114.1 insulinase family protein [Flavobacterium sp. F-70]
MKKIHTILILLFVTGSMLAQDRPQPKPGNSPVVNIKKPQTFVLANGMKVLIVENHKLPRVSFNLSLDNAPFTEGNKKGVDELTSSLIGNGTKKTPKETFNEEIDFYGANINFSSNGAFASSLSKYSGRVLELLAEGALQPNFTQVEFDKEKAKLIEGLKADEKSVPAIANRVVDVLAFGKNHPSGEFISEETLKNVTLADVEANYNNYFVPENAYLVVIGDIKFKETKAAVEKLFSGWKKQTAPKSTYPNPENVSKLQIDFVDVPNAVQSEITLVNTVNLKMSDPDFFPAVIANQILGGDFNSYLNMNLREKHAWTYGARSSIGSGKYVTTFKATSAVRNAVTDSAVVEFVKEIKRIRTDKVDPEVLKNVKAGYIGRFVMQVEKPQTVARYALNIETEKLPADFYEKYIQTVNNVTPEDIYRVANKYFLLDNIRIVIAGKGSEVIAGLEKTQIPLFFFDKYGNPVEKPVTKKELPAGITAKSVIDNYIKAIGGEKAVSAAKTLSMTGSTTIPQAPTPLSFVSKLDSKGKMMISLSMGTMALMKQVVNEKGAYIEQQGQRKNLEGADLAEMKASATPFEELQLSKRTDLKVDRIEAVNGNDAYVIKDGKTAYFYDVKSGLKVAESKVREQGGQSMTQITNFNDYKEVKGVKVPFNIVQNVGFELDIKMSDIKINEGVSDADFQ